MDEPVDVLRRFNRAYTQRIGVLDDSYLETGRPLGPSRLLFDIGPDGATVADLRQQLGLDSGYLSRLLRRLEDEGLIEVGAADGDGRRRTATLTPAGGAEWRRIDERARALADRLVAPLSPRLRTELAQALARAEQLLRAATAEATVVAPSSAPALEALGRYFAELDRRFPAGFDPDRGGTKDDDRALRRPHGAFVVLSTDAMVIGCGGVQRIAEGTAEIKRMWIDDGHRGLGLGRRLLGRLEDEARSLGHTRVVLDTNASLTEAIAMYERSGYRAIARYNDNPYAQHWFAKDLLHPSDG